MGRSPELAESVTRAIERRRGSHHRTDAVTGATWIDCKCPVHEDAHRSASYNPDGIFVCRVCGQVPLEQVAAALSVAVQPNGTTPHHPTPSLQLVEADRWSYDYYWPNGELSHRHWRIQYTAVDESGKPRKRYLHQSPTGDWHKPATYWPIYGDMGIPQGSHVVVTEGEPACDAINGRLLEIAGVPVRAITAGSAADLQASSEILVSRLKDLAPSSVTLWPDPDATGIKAMRHVRKALEQAHLPAAVVDPTEIKLTGKDDAVEFLQRGGNLALLLSSLQTPAPGPRPNDIANRVTVLRDCILWPGTQTISKLDHTHASGVWQSITGASPTDRQAKELLNILMHRQATDPVAAHWRVRATPDATYWRPEPMQDCYRLSREGIDVVPDVDSGVLLVPGASVVPSAVDLSADGERHYEQLCDLFGLPELERRLILAWWICVLTGREAPIILMKGMAGTGKSTLASYILGLVEPTLREIQVPDQRAWSDERQLIRTLQQVPAALVDNVSALSGVMEDTLSKLVTGYNGSVMWKYSNDVEQVRMRRGLILTTTNYDVYKGDLASRIILVNPTNSGWIDRDVINQRYLPMLPSIRGWVFKLVCQCYLPHTPDTSFRIASVGDVLTSLGYDAPALAQREMTAKAAVIGQNDPWLLSLVDIWERTNEGGEFLLSLAQIIDEMRAFGVPFEALPGATSPKFARWVEERNMILRDHGFTMHKHRDEKGRGYWFRRNRT